MSAQIAQRETEYDSPRAEVTPKVYLPPKEIEDEEAGEPSASLPPVGAPPPTSSPHRVSTPQTDNFFDKYGRTWTWDNWAKRLEHEALIIARTMESVMYGIAGGLVGLGLAGVPALFVDDYRHLIWQPIGAAIGMMFGVMRARKRWSARFQSHNDLT